MDQPEHLVALPVVGAQNPDPEQVVDLVDRLSAVTLLAVDGVEVLDAALHLQVESALGRPLEQQVAEAQQVLMAVVAPLGHELPDLLVDRRLQHAQRLILQLRLDAVHAQPPGQRTVDLQALLGDPFLPLRIQELERAHVVQLVGQLDDDHAHVARHRQQDLADRLRLLHGAALAAELRDLGDALHQLGDHQAEALAQLVLADPRVLDRVVQQTRAHRVGVHLRFDQDAPDGDRVDQKGLAAGAELPVVRRCGQLDRRADAVRLIRLVAGQLLGGKGQGLASRARFRVAHLHRAPRHRAAITRGRPARSRCTATSAKPASVSAASSLATCSAAVSSSR